MRPKEKGIRQETKSLQEKNKENFGLGETPEVLSVDG
jgi:hypothetical protein